MRTHSPLSSVIQPSTGPAAETRNTAAGYLYDHTSDFVAESMEKALRRTKMLTTLEMACALAGYLLNRVLPQLHTTRPVAAELEVSKPPGTAAIARAELG
jgi:hypothetical protein